MIITRKPIQYKNNGYSQALIILLIMNILFLLSAIVPIDGNAMNYAVTIVICGILLSYLIFVKRINKMKLQPAVLVFLILVIILLSFPIIYTHDLYIRLFVVKLILLIFYFKTSDITINNFTKIINFTYLVYLFFSILAWIKVLPGLDYTTINSFMVNFGPISIETLYGVSGSTADIDSYSAIIFLWNLLIYRGKYRGLLMLVSLISFLLTLRGTPLVSLSASIIVYMLVRNRSAAFFSLFIIALGLIGTIFIENYYPDEQVFFLSEEKDWSALFWDITHARSALWINQIDLYLNNFSWHHYIYGPDLKEMTAYFTRPDGLELEENYNPHNSYLITLYRSTVFFVVLYTAFIYYSIQIFHRKTFPIIYFISLAALTNSSIFGLENPIYILMILFIFINRKQIKEQFYMGEKNVIKKNH